MLEWRHCIDFINTRFGHGCNNVNSLMLEAMERYRPWARQNIGATQGGKTSMVQIFLLHQYKLGNM